MKEFINSLTGTRMFVSDEREAEYRAAGHRPVTNDAPGAASAASDAPPAVALGMEPASDPGAEDTPGSEPAAGSEATAEEIPAAKKSAAAPKRKAAAKK